jgi:hypothetical protein
MANLQKFGEYALDTAIEEQEALDAESSGEFMKLAVGRNVIRILPPLRGKNSPFRTTYQHYIDTADGKWVFTCPRVEAKKRCPVCERAQAMRASGNPADREQAYDLLPKRRVFCSVINRAEPDKGPMVLGFGKTIHEQLVALRRDEDTGGDFTHPTNGIDVVIDRAGSGKTDTRYTVNLARRTSPIHSDAAQVAAWADAMPDLDNFARLPSDEELLEKMEAVFGPGASQPQQRQRPAPKSRSQERRHTAQDDVQDAEFADSEGDGNEDWGMPKQ